MKILAGLFGGAGTGDDWGGQQGGGWEGRVRQGDEACVRAYRLENSSHLLEDGKSDLAAEIHAQRP